MSWQKSGSTDINKKHQDAWLALLADLSPGEQSIVVVVFGYTRLSQPDKQVTKAQAVVAVATEEATELVSEELAPIKAESLAETTVATHAALEAQVGDLNEDLIKDNFVIVYHLLDEKMDSGFPLTIQTNILNDIIAPPNIVSRMFKCEQYSSTRHCISCSMACK